MVGISAVEDKNGTLLCRHMGDFSLFIPSSQVHIKFFSRGEHDRRNGGFTASYLALPEKPAGNNQSNQSVHVIPYENRSPHLAN